MRPLTASLCLALVLTSAGSRADLTPPEVACSDEGESCQNGYGQEGVCVDGLCLDANDPEAVQRGGGCASCHVGDGDTAAGLAALGLYALAAALGGRRRRSPS